MGILRTSLLAACITAGIAFSHVAAAGPYTLLYSFTNGKDGMNPNSPLLVDASGLIYGATFEGNIFTYNPASGVETTLLAKSSAQWISLGPAGDIYGAQPFYSAKKTYGAVLKFDPATSVSTELHVFDKSDTAVDGAFPLSVIAAPGGAVFGQTQSGGQNQTGTLFKIGRQGEFSILMNYDAPVQFRGPLSLIGDHLYGAVCNDSGEYPSENYIYSVSTNTGAVTVVHRFDQDSYSCPMGILAPGKDGVIYGIAGFGGANNWGAIYQLDTKTGTVTDVYDLTASASTPTSLLLGPDRTLYGTLSGGGQSYAGVFALKIASGKFSLLGGHKAAKAFASPPGPRPGLVLENNSLYGTAFIGGRKSDGSIFSIGR